MGLDNGFIIRRKGDDIKDCVRIAYFRKFYELDSFIRQHCKEIEDDVFNVTLGDLHALESELEPITDVLTRIPTRLIGKYDDYGYPKKYKFDSIELTDERFNPIGSQSAFAGYKTMRLYHSVKTMIDFLGFNPDYEIVFYSSY